MKIGKLTILTLFLFGSSMIFCLDMIDYHKSSKHHCGVEFVSDTSSLCCCETIEFSDTSVYNTVGIQSPYITSSSHFFEIFKITKVTYHNIVTDFSTFYEPLKTIRLLI